MPHPAPLRLSVVYDNKAYDEKLKADWGFACLVEGLEKTILFDCGADGRILLANMEKLGIPPARLDVVVLSHKHRDHFGGLGALLSTHSKIEVWLPHAFGPLYRIRLRAKGAQVIDVEASRKICEDAYTTGVIEGWMNEQSLVLETERGLVLVTGCAHPGIIRIIDRVRDQFKKDLFLALGGFHLGRHQPEEIREIIRKFRFENIRQVGPAHCSGDEARALFREAYREDFLDIGVGKTIDL